MGTAKTVEGFVLDFGLGLQIMDSTGCCNYFLHFYCVALLNSIFTKLRMTSIMYIYSR